MVCFEKGVEVCCELSARTQAGNSQCLAGASQPPAAGDSRGCDSWTSVPSPAASVPVPQPLTQQPAHTQPSPVPCPLQGRPIPLPSPAFKGQPLALNAALSLTPKVNTLHSCHVEPQTFPLFILKTSGRLSKLTMMDS